MTSDTSCDDAPRLGSRLDNGHRARSAPADRDLARVNRELRKKVEFLEALGQLIIRDSGSLELMLEGVVRMLPAAWQYPEICGARALFRTLCYATPDWRCSPWLRSSNILVHGKPEGRLEVAYREPRPQADDGPFTWDEQTLLNVMTALLGKMAERSDASQQLVELVAQIEEERAAMKQANAALRGVLDHIEEERNAVRRSITANVDKMVMPIVQSLQALVSPQEQPIVSLLRRSLEEITSPFADNLSRQFASLTSLEIGICRMIRDNLTTKEIAKIRGVSPSTVARQREQIRRKLGISGSDANLANYLRTFLATAEVRPIGVKS
jgi:DNA-binding CsgD family transcriptional regulator